MLYFQNKENKILFGPPPPPKKRLNDTNGRDMSTRTSVCLYNQPVTWIFTKSVMSSLRILCKSCKCLLLYFFLMYNAIILYLKFLIFYSLQNLSFQLLATRCHRLSFEQYHDYFRLKYTHFVISLKMLHGIF